MEYKRLPFGQYYIDTSKDWRKTGKARFDIDFHHVEFTYKLFKLIPIKCSAEWEVHYEEDRNVIQINFEQTNGKMDWIINFLFKERMYDKFKWVNTIGKEVWIALKACKGWSQMYKAMKHDMKEAVRELLVQHPDAFIEIVGWSLGSGQAQFACQDIFWHFGILPYVYTYGSVKPWRGGKKQKEYLATTYKECYNFMHKSDIVTYMPPFIGFFAMKPKKLGKFNFFGLFNANKWHTEYGEDYLYEEV